MRNLHQLLLQEDGIEAWHLFRLWEKLQLRASEYKNHRIFTLRCIHNDLVPSSIKLKSTIKSTRANKILRKAEKDLLQARVKLINYTLDQTSKQLQECRSKLVTIVSTQKLRECQDFIDKVSEIRFNKVKLRQLNKLNLLTTKKEGNITRFNNTNTNNLASCNLNNSQLNLNNSQVNLNNSQVNLNNSQVNPPPREGTTPSQANPLTTREGITPSQVNTPPREGPVPSQASTSASTLLPREASTPPATAPPPGEASTPPASTLPTREGITPSQANTPLQATTHSYSLRSTQAGQANNTNRASRQDNRCPPPIVPPRLPRRSIPSPRKEILPSPPVGTPKVLPMKNLTLSGS